MASTSSAPTHAPAPPTALTGPLSPAPDPLRRRAHVLAALLALCTGLGLFALLSPGVARPGAWRAGFAASVALGGLVAPVVWRWGHRIGERSLSALLLLLDALVVFSVLANLDRGAAQINVVLLLLPVVYAAVFLGRARVRVQEVAVVVACALIMEDSLPLVASWVIRTALPAAAFLATAEVVVGLRAQLAATLARVELQALTDPLTGLLNRRGLSRALVEDDTGTGAYATVMMLDIDHFKTINDTLGHAVGDEVLARVADGLRASVRADDLVVRLGGEEFAIVSHTPPAQAAVVAERLLALAKEWMAPWSATVSIGVVTRAQEEQSHQLDPEVLAGLLETADGCLYQAKRTGRDRVVLAGQG